MAIAAKKGAYQPVGLTQVHSQVDIPVMFQGNGAAAPVPAVSPLGGDPKAAYFSVVRNSAGNYTFTTKYSYAKCVAFSPTWCAATPSSTKIVSSGVPTKNANDTFSVVVLTSVSGAATDLPAGDYLSLYFSFSESTVLP